MGIRDRIEGAWQKSTVQVVAGVAALVTGLGLGAAGSNAIFPNSGASAGNPSGTSVTQLNGGTNNGEKPKQAPPSGPDQYQVGVLAVQGANGARVEVIEGDKVVSDAANTPANLQRALDRAAGILKQERQESPDAGQVLVMNTTLGAGVGAKPGITTQLEVIPGQNPAPAGPVDYLLWEAQRAGVQVSDKPNSGIAVAGTNELPLSAVKDDLAAVAGKLGGPVAMITPNGSTEITSKGQITVASNSDVTAPSTTPGQSGGGRGGHRVG